MTCTHFIGFRSEEYWSAVKIWGSPNFIHQGWDQRAKREMGEGDVIIFAKGDDTQPVSKFNYPDLLGNA